MNRYTSQAYQAKVADDRGLIHYTESEHQMWSDLYRAQISLVNRYMVKEYKEGLDHLDMPHHRIPQCVEISEQLKYLNGWQVEPVPALIGYGRFFKLLASRKFPAASFIRRAEDFDYVKEPDIFHELFGHIPLLTHPAVATFSHAIGLLGANTQPENHPWLARLYWFTIEFGLVRDDNNQIMPMGSGLASSPTELKYAATSEEPQRLDFDVMDVLTTPYRIDIQQPIYYVLESIDQLLEIANRDLLADIAAAKLIGLKKPHHKLAKAC